MRFLVLFALLVQHWTTATTLVPVDNMGPVVVYVWGNGGNAAANFPHRNLPSDEWHTIDIPADLPTETSALVLSGLLGSTGATGLQCGVVAAVRGPDSTLYEGSYQVQAVASMPSGAFRQNATVLVPVKHRQFEFWWHAQYEACPLFLQFQIQEVKVGGQPLSSAPALAVTVASALTVTLANGPGDRLDWVSLYPQGSNDFVEWQYLNGLHSAPISGTGTTSLIFAKPPAGAYVLRLFSSAASAFVASLNVTVP